MNRNFSPFVESATSELDGMSLTLGIQVNDCDGLCSIYSSTKGHKIMLYLNLNHNHPLSLSLSLSLLL
jgi:hypothetical protein